MSDKRDLENKEEELNLDEEFEQEIDFEEESEDEQEIDFEEESEDEQEEFEEESEDEQEEFEEESEYEHEEEFEEESEDEHEEEFEEESEDEYEEEFEEESEDEQEEEFEEESEEVENKRDTKRLVVYGVGAIALAGIGFVGYNTFFAKPTYVMPDRSSTVSSSNQYDYAEDSYIENNSDISSLIGEENSTHADSPEQILDHETTDYNDDINLTPEHHYEGSETYKIEAEGEVLGYQQAENVVSLTQSEYDSLIERIERLESLVADNEEQIINIENRFNVFDELISTMDSVNERIGQVEEDINQIQESFDIIKDLQESYKNISHEFEEIKESESQSSSATETPVEKNNVVVERNSEVEERTSNNTSSTNTKATTTKRSNYIPESQRPAIPNWRGVAKIDNGQMIGIDLGDGRFITLVEGEPVKVYGPVQRIASDGTVYFRTHKINFIQ